MKALTNVQIVLFILRGVFCLFLPAAAFLILRKYGGRFYPVVTGIAAMLLLIIPRGLIRSLLVPQTEGFLARYLLADLIGACCEEYGRFIAMKYMMPNHEGFPDALCYGIGHSSIEGVAVSLNQFGILAKCLDGTANAAMYSQSWLAAADIFAGETASLIFHMMMSVLIILSVGNKSCRKYLPLAIILHILFNIAGDWFGIFAGLLLLLCICCLTYKIYQSQTKTEEFT